MAMRCKEILAVLSVTVLAGCASVDPVSQSPDPAFGESVRYNAAIQTVNPNPVYPADSSQPGERGDVAQESVERLRTGQTGDRHNSEVSSAKSSTVSTTTGVASGGPQ
jgi:hypothetical protein